MLPQRFNGLRAIPAIGHAHVDEGQGVGPLVARCIEQFAQAFLATVGRIEFEHGGDGLGCFAEQGVFQGIEIGVGGAFRGQDLAKIVMDRRRVVDQQDAPVAGLGHDSPSAIINGICRTKRAPLPGPSL
ncbi:hypothetical protein D9M71_588970 [compost metagenome]